MWVAVITFLHAREVHYAHHLDPPSPAHASDFTTAKDNVQTNIEVEKGQTYAIEKPPHYKILYPNVDEAALLRKIDLRLVPILSALYILAFLDRCVAFLLA